MSDEAPDAILRRDYAGERLLIVEDDQFNRFVVEDLLEGFGFLLESAEDGQQALDLANSSTFDLILMDLQMPVMGGLEATLRIRELPYYADVPIVAITANAFEEDRRACLEAGMNDHLSKPFTTDDFYATLLKWLRIRHQTKK